MAKTVSRSKRASTREALSRARTPLSRARIAAGALALIDAGGLENLSMRALGRELGVEAMALYHHFPSKGELLDAVAEVILQEVRLPGAEIADPIERIAESLRLYRGLARRHPHAFVLLTTRRFNSPRAFAFYEELLGLYFDAGFDAKTTARFFRLGGYFVAGAGHAEIASGEAQPDATPVVLERADAALAEFPRVRAVAPHLRRSRLDDIFEHGLAVIVAAMRAARRRTKPPKRP